MGDDLLDSQLRFVVEVLPRFDDDVEVYDTKMVGDRWSWYGSLFVDKWLFSRETLLSQTTPGVVWDRARARAFFVSKRVYDLDQGAITLRVV